MDISVFSPGTNNLHFFQFLMIDLVHDGEQQKNRFSSKFKQ